MKKNFLGIILFAMMLLIVGCGNNNTNGNNANGNNANGNNTAANNEDLSGTIMITGSTSVEKILHDMIDEFVAYNPDVTINYTGTGSSSGISDTLTGANDIGVSSRQLKEAEQIEGLKEVTFAYDGIAVIVNPNNPVENVTISDLVKIYSGEITNWKELGGNDASIIVVSREDASGTRNAYEEIIKLSDAGGLNMNATVVEGNGNVQTAVAGNDNAIGYVSFSYINSTVKDLTIDGVEATAENAKSGEYSLSRPFLMVYMEADSTSVSKAFIEYAVSPDAQDFVTKHGGIRVD